MNSPSPTTLVISRHKLHSRRLLITPANSQDWRALLQATQHILFPSELPLAHVTSEALARQWMDSGIAQWDAGTGFIWSVLTQAEPRVVGQISLNWFPSVGLWSLAYWIHPDHWRKGYAYEACESLLKHLATSNGAIDLWIGAPVWNHASQRLASKLKFCFIGTKDIELKSGEILTLHEYIRNLGT